MAKRKTRVRISAGELRRLYHDEGESLQDIAEAFHTSRTTVMNKMREYKIDMRSKSAARRLAYAKGKIDIRKHQYDTEFFNSIGNPQAYAMGLIWAGGYITDRILHIMCGESNVDVCSKLGELLSSQYPKYIEPKTRAEIWATITNSVALVKSLSALGLVEGTKANQCVPELSEPLRRHFIRGWWERRGFSAISVLAMDAIEEWLPGDIKMYRRNELATFEGVFTNLHDIEETYSELYSDVHPGFIIQRRRNEFVNQETTRTARFCPRGVRAEGFGLPSTPDRPVTAFRIQVGPVLSGTVPL